jgi:hypothetical protein
VPSLREYTARWGVTPDRLRPGQKIMHPGPMNRGVEIDPEVADDQDALIVSQVRAGLVVRMAVLYDLLTHGPGARRDRGDRRDPPRGRVMGVLYARSAPKESLVVTGARVLDPVEGIDATVDVRVDDGVIAAIGTALERNAHRVVDGTGLVLAPAFVDPHVHLRTPGREDEETIASGTAAAAAGGYCAILAMPNTEPVVDSAAVLGSLIERARTDATIPSAFSRRSRRPEGSGADRDGRARRRRRRRLHG